MQFAVANLGIKLANGRYKKP